VNEKPYNPDDPLFLFSRSLDEALNDVDRQCLSEAMALGSVRREAEEFSAVDRLLKRWALTRADLDAGFEAAAPTQREEVDPIDQLLARWGRTPVEVDWDGFTATVMAEVQSGRRMPALYRWALPLAAAAAVAFAVVTTFRTPDLPFSENIVRYGSSSDATEIMRVALAPSMIVSYGPPAGEEGFRPPSMAPNLSYGSVGSAPIAVSSFDSPPL